MPASRGLAVLFALPLLAAACSGVESASAVQQSGPALFHRPSLQESTPDTIGLSETQEGYSFVSDESVLPPDKTYRFRILNPNGQPEMDYVWAESKKMHFLAVRDDFTGFVHVHPALSPDGTWTVQLPLTEPGPYELYADFMIGDAKTVAAASGEPGHFVLRRTIVVPGPYVLAPIVPSPSTSASADGYTITFDMKHITTMDGTPLNGPQSYTVMYMPAHVTYQGRPFNGIEPWLGTFGHLTAFNVQNHLMGHAHPLEYAGGGREVWDEVGHALVPSSDDRSSTTPVVHGGKTLTFHAEFPGSGDYRVFVEFQVNGVIHTLLFTLHVS